MVGRAQVQFADGTTMEVGVVNWQIDLQSMLHTPRPSVSLRFKRSDTLFGPMDRAIKRIGGIMGRQAKAKTVTAEEIAQAEAEAAARAGFQAEDSGPEWDQLTPMQQRERRNARQAAIDAVKSRKAIIKENEIPVADGDVAHLTLAEVRDSLPKNGDAAAEK